MKKTLLKQQIPTIVALIILFIGAGAGVLLVGRRVEFLPRAGPEFEPKNITTTNLTDKSFTVTWITDAATTGFVRYGTSQSLSTTISDDRDQLSGQSENFKLHHVTIRGLNPDTNYFYKIGSGPASTLYDNNGQAYQLSTGPSIGASPDSETSYGQVVTSVQTPADGAIIFVSIDSSSQLSALVKSSGSWAVSLSTIRAQDLSRYLQYDPKDDIINIKVVGPDGLSTSGITSTQNDQPVPTITLGQDFDFTSGATSTPTLQPATPSPQPTPKLQGDTQTPDPQGGFNLNSLGDIPQSTSSAVVLHNPSKDGEQINTTRPDFQGIAPPNTTVTITVESPQTYQGQVITDEFGNFNWEPPENLEPGAHTITVSYTDQNGILQQLKRSFTVLAQGQSSLPALTSTPSGQPTTSTPTPSPTPPPILTSTPIPTISPSPGSTTSTRTSQPSTQSGIPIAGVSTPTILMSLMGLALIGSGTFLSKKLSN